MKTISMHAYPASPAVADKSPARKKPRAFANSRDINEDRSRRQIKLSQKGNTIRSEVKASQSRPAVALLRPASKQPLLLSEQASYGTALQRVQFSFLRPWARAVCLAGSFNNWKGEPMLLSHDSAGAWTVDLQLMPGAYEYRFVVDGAWEDDPLAKRYVQNPFGSLNSVVDVRAPKTATPSE